VIVGGTGADRWEADAGDTVVDAEIEDPGHCAVRRMFRSAEPANE
jgi:hypothetical protein